MVVTIANSDPLETILEGNQKKCRKFRNLFCNVPITTVIFVIHRLRAMMRIKKIIKGLVFILPRLPPINLAVIG